MKSVNVRGISDELDKALKAAAAKRGVSMNQVMLDALRAQFGLTKEKRFTRTHDDLDDLFGRWSQKEYEAVQGKIDSERAVDPELWR